MLEVFIKKSLNDNYVFIRREILTTAIRNGNKLKVIIPGGEEIINPTKWLKGKKIEKIFKRPDEPMILFGGKVAINKKEKFLTNQQCTIF